MADINVPINLVHRGGRDVAFTPNGVAADKYFIENNGRTILLINKIANSNDCKVTAITTAKIDGEAVDNKEITVGGIKAVGFGPFPPEFYNDEDSRVEISLAGGAADVRLAAITT